jgi:hypothetical protein
VCTTASATTKSHPQVHGDVFVVNLYNSNGWKNTSNVAVVLGQQQQQQQQARECACAVRLCFHTSVCRSQRMRKQDSLFVNEPFFSSTRSILRIALKCQKEGIEKQIRIGQAHGHDW